MYFFRSYLEKNVRLLMESVDELCQDANKFNNHLRNVARQQQQKDSYIQRRVNSLFSLFNKEIISSVPHDIALIVGCTKLLSFKYSLFSSKHFVLCKTVILFQSKTNHWILYHTHLYSCVTSDFFPYICSKMRMLHGILEGNLLYQRKTFPRYSSPYSRRHALTTFCYLSK